MKMNNVIIINIPIKIK